MAKKKKKPKTRANSASSRGVVGPDYMQVLTGKIASKSVSIILCGESHRDAIDVTRTGGGKEKLGWQSISALDLVAEMVGSIGISLCTGRPSGQGPGIGDDSIRLKVCICKRSNKPLPLGKAKEWSSDIGHAEIEYIDPGHEMAFIWLPLSDGKRGKAYLIELFIDLSDKEDNSRSRLPPDVASFLESLDEVIDNLRGTEKLAKSVETLRNKSECKSDDITFSLFLWSDLDSEARQLNHRRILSEEITNEEYDALINDRKKKRQAAENLWTFDDWLTEVNTDDSPSCRFVLEAPILPWEVELCRDLRPDIEYTEAADIIRCLSEDSDSSEIDDHDPSSDGLGSYLDYIYRRFLADEQQTDIEKKFLHCVDSRDMGCENSVVCDSLHRHWLGLLESEEKELVLNSDPASKRKSKQDERCLPDWCNNPEKSRFDQLLSEGVLKPLPEDSDSDDDTEDETEEEMITLPSLESFFGQCTDVMYYTPQVKVSYAPFLSQCVKSLDTWDTFFRELFFGGSVDSAFSMLDLSQDNLQFIHLRSPILKHWNIGKGDYEWHERNDTEYDLTMPILPKSASKNLELSSVQLRS